MNFTQSVDRLRAYIQSLTSSIKDKNEPQQKGFLLEVMFSDQDYGTLFLTGEEAREYRQCLQMFLRLGVPDDLRSKKHIEKLIQRTILKSIDYVGKDNHLSEDQKLDRAIQQLKDDFFVEGNKYTVYYPIENLSIDGLPFSIGGITLCQLDEKETGKLVELLKMGDQDSSDVLKRPLVQNTINEFSGNVFARVEVVAHDNEAARARALTNVRRIVDILNFFSDLVPYSSGYIFLPGTNEITNSTVIGANHKTKDFVSSSKMVGALTEFSVKDLLLAEEKFDLRLNQIKGLLEKSAPGPIEKAILASIEWAGRATVDDRKEEAYLQCVIALECLLIGRHELGIKLKLKSRTGKLLADNSENAKKIETIVGEMYKKRSEIVHNGQYQEKYQILDMDLKAALAIVKQCIYQVLRDPRFDQTTTFGQFKNWFE